MFSKTKVGFLKKMDKNNRNYSDDQMVGSKERFSFASSDIYEMLVFYIIVN